MRMRTSGHAFKIGVTGNLNDFRHGRLFFSWQAHVPQLLRMRTCVLFDPHVHSSPVQVMQCSPGFKVQSRFYSPVQSSPVQVLQ
jgi:hypothetical protein